LYTQSRVIYTNSDISSIIDDVIINFNKTREASYIKLFNLFKIDIHVAKVKALTASSYIELPDKIANKKAVINIKNEDNLCFVYSVLCGLKTPEKDAQRVSKYKDRLHELQYKPEDMPMDINKIIHFEKRNNLRISVFGLARALACVRACVRVCDCVCMCTCICARACACACACAFAAALQLRCRCSANMNNYFKLKNSSSRLY
jgi:hypothetical protein